MIFQKLATKRKKKENKPCILKRFLNYGMQMEKKVLQICGLILIKHLWRQTVKCKI